jgi:hypothetical protein
MQAEEYVFNRRNAILLQKRSEAAGPEYLHCIKPLHVMGHSATTKKQMEKFELTGGARIGTSNATWPFATLKVSKEKLELNASIAGNLIFQPKDIISIEEYKMFPLIAQGIKINHRISKYNQKVIFWTHKEPSTVINQIRHTGFFDNVDSTISETDRLILKQQQSGGFPFKKTVAIAVITFWNIFIIYDFIIFATSDTIQRPLGDGTTIALAALLLISILSLTSRDFSKLILKEGKSIKDIDTFLYLLIFITGFMLFILLDTRNL